MTPDFDIETLRSDAPLLASQQESQRMTSLDAYLHFYRLNFVGLYPAARHYFGRFEAAGETLYGHVWALPDAELTAYICHGYYDHAGLFSHVVDYCLSRNMSVVVWDFPGHGLSTGDRASIDDFDNYLDAIDAILEVTADFAISKRRIIFGQSMGGAITMSYLLWRHAEYFEKAVLLAPLVRPTAHWWARPVHAVAKFFTKHFKRNFGESSSDGKFLRFLRKSDPLQAKYLALPWFAAWKVWEKRFMTLGESTLRPLIIQGDDDHTVAWQYNLQVLERLFPKAEVVTLRGAKHHLVNESKEIRDRVWQAVDDFLT